METSSNIIAVLKKEKELKIKGGLYHKTMVDLTYNSNHIEGSKLTKEQTRYIFETKTIGMIEPSVPVDDIIETINHFKAVDFIIDNYDKPLSESFVKELHKILKSGTLQSQDSNFNVGDYKKLPNIVGDNETCPPEKVGESIRKLLSDYGKLNEKVLDEILDFHVKFEAIHPFQDGNGRVGRLIMFKECLNNDIVPFIIMDELKAFYYRGLRTWNQEKGYLRDTCLTGQDYYKKLCNYFKIPFESSPEHPDITKPPKQGIHF